MSDRKQEALAAVFALAALLIFAMVFGLAMDNHAARLDPASPYYSASE